MENLRIKQVNEESEAQEELLIDNEGPNLTIHQERKNTFLVYTRKPFSKTIMGEQGSKLGLPENWSLCCPDWDGLLIFRVRRASRDTITKQLQERFKCEVIWET